MLFRSHTLEGIAEGNVTVAFRRWRRPTVRAGGTLLTAVGQLGIEAVDPIALDEITEVDARAAGYRSRDALLDELARRREGQVYRIRLGVLRPDPRVALRRSNTMTDAESRDVRARLSRLDARAAGGPWTQAVLETLAARPGVRAGDLCGLVGQEKTAFKANVRKLKGLGLTVSLDIGYRLSPRGEAVLDALRHPPGGAR